MRLGKNYFIISVRSPCCVAQSSSLSSVCVCECECVCVCVILFGRHVWRVRVCLYVWECPFGGRPTSPISIIQNIENIFTYALRSTTTTTTTTSHTYMCQVTHATSASPLRWTSCVLLMMMANINNLRHYRHHISRCVLCINFEAHLPPHSHPTPLFKHCTAHRRYPRRSPVVGAFFQFASQMRSNTCTRPPSPHPSIISLVVGHAGNSLWKCVDVCARMEYNMRLNGYWSTSNTSHTSQ